MIIITIKPLRAELVDFNIKDDTAEMNVYFSDEADEHKIAINQKIVDSEELAEQMIMKMRQMVKKFHPLRDDDHLDLLSIKVEGEEDAVQKLKRFFDNVKEKIKNVKMIKSSQGYLDTLNRAKKLETNL